MAKITDKTVNETQERILQGNDLVDIRRDLRAAGYSGTQVNDVVLKAKEAIRERTEELKDILPELNLYRLNQLYITSINANVKDRAYIVREINQMLGLYKQEVDLNVGFNFVIDENDDLIPDADETK